MWILEHKPRSWILDVTEFEWRTAMRETIIFYGPQARLLHASRSREGGHVMRVRIPSLRLLGRLFFLPSFLPSLQQQIRSNQRASQLQPPIVLRSFTTRRHDSRTRKTDTNQPELLGLRIRWGWLLLWSICADPGPENRFIPVFWPRVSTEASL